MRTVFLLLFLPAMMVTPASSQILSEKQLAPISEMVKKTIQAGKIPGAVILIGQQGKIVYRRAFGFRALKPKKLPMTTDTIFDVASLTKVIATSTAIAQLIEMEKLNLEDPVARYWPEFKANGKEEITVRDLLTHYSGLRPALDSKSEWSGYESALRIVEEEIPIFPQGTSFVYSDINFIALAELVSRISGESFDLYCAEHIFKPLGMTDTGFTPSPALRSRIAPTLYQQRTGGKILWGEVHDPVARAMGGVAGHAGLFSTADDLSIFAQMILDRGSRAGMEILSSRIVEKMILPQSPTDKVPLRGLGWNIDCSLASGSFGHTGFTGTGIWIDPSSSTFVIILTNRVHPDGKGNVQPLRTKVLSLVSEATGGSGRLSVGFHYEQGTDHNGNVQTGIDVLAAEKFNSLRGLRVGLITNHSGIDSTGKRTVDLFYKSRDLKLAAIFSPEHGFSGKAEGKVSSTKEALTGVPIYSLYGTNLRPTPKMLAGLDALVFDVQDAGARFYTYISTMGYAMEACAKKGIPFFVLDRPNPINASMVQGPLLDSDLTSFTGYFPLPVRHGMTVGELAKMFQSEKKMGVKLHVITMRGYERSQWYDETGLLWISPSPNLQTLTQAILYPGVALVEGANVSVGRGT
ncbi:MAG: exo-beta-N-acetylmuramidase NamZ domain-containing protein, partial [Thermodesulfobacteriota bacterium]